MRDSKKLDANTRLCRLGVDIGGTFTDIVLAWDDDTLATKKVPSTPDDYSQGIINGIGQLIAELSLSPLAVKQVIHGTTVATNAILEGKGARTALITTKGFRDVLELRRIRIPRLYDLFYEKPSPLVPRRFRLEVKERVDARGQVLTPLDQAEARAVISKIEADQIEAVAVCFLNSFAQPSHEQQVGELVRQALPDVYLTLSVDVLPEIREYERTSTTVINAYVGPVVKRYLRSLLEQLATIKVQGPLLIMQSSGGIMTAEAAIQTPAYIVESGPAAGAVAAARLAQAAGYPNVLSFDMGGTTAKASMIEDGHVVRTSEAEVGGGITLSSRLIKGGGYALKLPAIDLSEVGAGGGSIARVDRGGALKVGPDSAGADPGPVCYDRGGQEPTVTDANVVLGYINPEYLAGRSVRLNSQKSREVLDRKLARPLNKSLYEAAYGVFTIANVTMIRALKAVSTYRGRDPRNFDLFAFGGSGPIHAAEMARALGMKRVVVPLTPGLFSAVGLLFADIECHAVQTFFQRSAEASAEKLNARLTAMERDARIQLAAAGYQDSEVAIERLADLRYSGQAYELTVPVPDGHLEAGSITALAASFEREHERTYGHKALDEPVDIVNLRLIARALQEKPQIFKFSATMDQADSNHAPRRPVQQRQAYFGPTHGLLDTPVLNRSDLSGKMRTGPLIIEEYDATMVIPPGCQAMLDAWGNVVISVG